MPNTSHRFHPAYSTVKSIKFDNGLDISVYNPQCRFDKVELVENITDVFPVGTLVVTDTNDILSYIGSNNIQTLTIEFLSGDKIYGYITSVSYINNAASDNETTVVAINFTNSYYQYFSSTSLNALLGYQKPQVFSVNEFVTMMRTQIFGSETDSLNHGYQDFATNFFLYKPFIPYNSGEEAVPDNAIELMTYLATGAVDSDKNPYFMFWTSFGGGVNFKSFKRDITQDDSYASIDSDYRNIAVYSGDGVTRKLSDGKTYRKAYFVATNPAYQWISKNYYCIRKTPKHLDELPVIAIPTGLTGQALEDAKTDALIKQQNIATKNLTFQFQDDGQKYNIDVITVSGRATDAPAGGDNIFIDHTWGYYNDQDPSNNKSVTNLIGNQYGTDLNYSDLKLMGTKQNMPFLDSPDMWKNMFDLTPIHPHYPDEKTLPVTDKSLGIKGSDTNLQKVMDIRYDTFQAKILGSSSERLEKIRSIEAQNFVLYSLCCLGQKEDCFFAVLQRYEPDSTYYGLSGGSGGTTFDGGAKYYRYKWNKIEFASGITGSSGASGGSSGSSGSSGATCGPNGSTYTAHQLEKWSLSCSIKSSSTQDDTWAINLNERGLTGQYLPPGWVKPTTGTFKFRPIGAVDSSTFNSSADIFHIARVCVKQISPNESVTYFWAENIVDGIC